MLPGLPTPPSPRVSPLWAFFSTGALLFFITAMLLFPEATYQGALQGLALWGTILVPSLLPFFILAEIILNLGLLQMLGVLLEPLMRPLFNLPGAASFVLAMGFTSGFPMGAVLSRRLYETKECTRSEAERLVTFTNNASPLFLLVAVGVGMFRHPTLGLLLLLAHYSANLLLGIGLGFFSRLFPTEKNQKRTNPVTTSGLLSRSIQVFLTAQEKRKPWSLILQDAIQRGIKTICLIGGFVIIYAVLIKILTVTSLLALAQYPLTLLLEAIHFDTALAPALATGFWEMTLGLQETAQSLTFLPEKVIIASFLLGWSGLSVQSQVSGVLAGSGISPRLYYHSRLGQAFLASIISYALLQHHDWLTLLTLPALSLPLTTSFWAFSLFHLLYLGKIFYLSFCTLLFLGGVSLALNFFQSN